MFFGYPTEYPIEINERCEQFDDSMRDRPGEIEDAVAHSKASAVVDVWLTRHPGFNGKHKADAAHYEDLLSRERMKDELKGFRADRSAS